MSFIIKNHLYKESQWNDEQSLIKAHIQTGKRVIFTKHFRDSLEDRALSVGEVYSIFKNGSAEIIQGHAPGTYAIGGGSLNSDEVRVFYGKTKSGKTIHIVFAITSDGKYKFVTVYYPSLEFFENDYKTLRSAFCFTPVKS
ncbi:DUF4258 domain-containing protein [Cytobacillus sp. FJAT-54145]|uniref:DUF4258 domain-containing protein n=1 Tax=Cytobacillus spartinae TaxID=3299023 RepID=A0ABW6KDM1_9BACI